MTYRETMVTLAQGQRIARDDILRALVRIQYQRNDVAFERGTFRVRGDTVEIFPAYEEQGVRIEMWGDEIERMSKIDALTGETIATLERTAIYPAKHFITSRPTLERAVGDIRAELNERLDVLRKAEQKLLEAQRLESRTNFDIEMMLEIGTCAGIENYSRHLAGRAAGRAAGLPARLLPRGFSRDGRRVARDAAADARHVQRRPRAQADAGGVRLPSAERARQPPAHVRRVPVARAAHDLRVGHARRARAAAVGRAWWWSRSSGPPGLVDPEIEVRPVRGQVDDLLHEIRLREQRGERVLVTTLTKRMAEDLTDYLQQMGVRVRYMHSDIDAIERMEIVRGLRLGEFDVLVGINLLREGLDLPEVSLVAILDADQEGFLRSDRSLIQTVGRAARHVDGRAIFYADRITGSMQRCIERDGPPSRDAAGAQRGAWHHAARAW